MFMNRFGEQQTLKKCSMRGCDVTAIYAIYAIAYAERSRGYR